MPAGGAVAFKLAAGGAAPGAEAFDAAGGGATAFGAAAFAAAFLGGGAVWPFAFAAEPSAGLLKQRQRFAITPGLAATTGAPPLLAAADAGGAPPVSAFLSNVGELLTVPPKKRTFSCSCFGLRV